VFHAVLVGEIGNDGVRDFARGAGHRPEWVIGFAEFGHNGAADCSGGSGD
jgi:hypothetical protein